MRYQGVCGLRKNRHDTEYAQIKSSVILLLGLPASRMSFTAFTAQKYWNVFSPKQASISP